MIFQNLREVDGLSAKQVRCLYKDPEGFLWIGTTNGLNRYDGHTIKRYPKNVYVNAIFPIDGEENLLVGTSKGLLVFNKKKRNFLFDQRFKSLSGKTICSVKPDGFKRLWIVTNSEIYILSHSKLLPIEQALPFAKILKGQDYTSTGFTAFCWDSLRQGFWIGGPKSFFVDCKNRLVYSKEHNPLNIPILATALVTSIALDKDFNLWYGTTSDFSLRFWNHQKKSVTTYGAFEGRKDGCNYLFVDKKNRLWISTWLFSAFYKEPGKPIQKIPYSQDQPFSIGYGHFREAFEDLDGSIWFATINGVSKNQSNEPIQSIHKFPSMEFYLDSGFAHINSIKAYPDRIMAAKEDGIYDYNINDHTYRRFIAVSRGDMMQNRFDYAVRATDTWWFSGSGGIYFLDQKNQKLRRFPKVKQGMPRTDATFVIEDKTGKIWFQIYRDALYRYDPKSDICERIDGKEPKTGLFDYKYCHSVLKLRNGNLLFAMDGVGYLLFNIGSQRFSTIPVHDAGNFQVSESLEDREGNIWSAVATKGILKYNLKGQYLDGINTNNGLPLDNINSIAQDDRGAIWAASREGLMYFYPDTKEITRVQIDLGKTLQDYWNHVSIYNKLVYAVMLDHVIVIDPFKFATIIPKKAPHITSVKIFEKEISDSPTDTTFDLSAEENFISFQYASLYHRDIPSLQYSYQFEGIDNNWINAGKTDIVSYNNLAPGQYTFKVRSTNEEGKWMNDIAIVKINVRPQWWQTWWFFIFMGLVAFIAFRLIYMALIKRRQKIIFEQTIDYFANSVYGENSVDEICWDIARNCISHLNFEDCVVYLWDAEKGKLVQKAAYGLKNVREHEIINPIELEIGEGIVGAAAEAKKTLIIPNTNKDKRYIIDDKKRLSEISVPIIHEGKVIGVIDSENSNKNFFKREHARALSTIASISANKIAEAQAEDEAQTKEMMLLEISKMLAESQLMALRAQMNPHFVFNCLNSIQACIVTAKYGEASKYLNKFSKLFRMVLNNSDQNMVSIEDETEVLELYLELEQMRFEQSFTYKITVDEDLQDEEIVLPSMLLQPYVENALWHGLMHKKGSRELLINFEKVNDDIFKCIIEDNGIGRKKSFEIKELTSKLKRHKSKGLQISKDRLDLLQRQGQHASVTINDKYDSNGAPSGTLVMIELSTYLNNT
ncbi:sensor histidine kinase [Dyadobacter arcticus]|uniref:Ligand-binding sensor domain-containing protein/putative methionine-R-sulfoxide reductase with GAF domain n=1 Tax=Dyadobacter arcticus TaxID=1078754 RepID=A0ABX0UKT4_9BACT|nr:histidine kinase [Dyadobacter arcticus]NIJ53626.1 ligand-binding sensor domain-containing protein/putative methionine-R-sulfoxide reductase with GAF domain [Dyadobacter arcticus]